MNFKNIDYIHLNNQINEINKNTILLNYKNKNILKIICEKINFNDNNKRFIGNQTDREKEINNCNN